MKTVRFFSFVLLLILITSTVLGRNKMKINQYGHYAFHYYETDSFSIADQEFHVSFIKEVTKTLNVALPNKKIHYYKYPNLQTKEELSKVKGNAHASLSGSPTDPNTEYEIHTIYKRDNHEIVHILLFPYGIPVALFREGIAVHISGGWHGESLFASAKQLIKDKKIISLETILDEKEFLKNEIINYPVAGYFTQFLISRNGIDLYMNLYKNISSYGFNLNKADLDTILQKLYKASLSKLEKEMLKSLE